MWAPPPPPPPPTAKAPPASLGPPPPGEGSWLPSKILEPRLDGGPEPEDDLVSLAKARDRLEAVPSMDEVPRRNCTPVKMGIGAAFLLAVTLMSISWIWRADRNWNPAPPAAVASCFPPAGSTASLPLQPQPSGAQGDQYCTRGYGLMPAQSFPSRVTVGNKEVQITDKLDRATLADCKAECDRFAECAGFLRCRSVHMLGAASCIAYRAWRRGVDTDDAAAFNGVTWSDELGTKPNRTAAW
jgi:hypothetical protein